MRDFYGRCVLVITVLIGGSAVLWASPALAQIIYGTDNSGRSCIANGVDCAAPLSNGPTGRRAASVYAAIATADPQDVIGYGIGSGFYSRAAAETAALNGCEDQAEKNNPKYKKIKACTVKMWFYDTCGAIATSPTGGAGWQWSPSLRTAQARALSRCQSGSKDKCTLMKAWCVHG